MNDLLTAIKRTETKESDVELKELVGEHMLDAVDMSTEQVQTWGESFEDANVLRFRLDGKVYTAVEDPNDGYRSSMSDITVGEGEMKNVFAPVRVLATHRTAGSYGYVDDVLVLTDIVSGKSVLEVGTTAINDYYPGFVADWMPENLAHNNQVERRLKAVSSDE